MVLPMMRILLFSLVLLLMACHSGKSPFYTKENGDTIALQYAKLLTMVKYKHFVRVDIRDPWHKGQTLQTYILVARGEGIPSGVEGQVVRVPLQRAAVFTAPHCQLVQWLGAWNRVKAVADSRFMVQPTVQRSVAQGKVVDLGSSLSPDVEQLVATNCDALILSPYENTPTYGKLEQAGVPLVLAADYMETSSLGRAEWMRFYGLLFGQAERADSLFEVVDSTYRSLRQCATRLPVGRSIVTERVTGGVWYAPGGRSTTASIIRDANGRYAFMQDLHMGSLSLSPEEGLVRFGEADVWAFKSLGTQPLSRKQIVREYVGHSQLKAFKRGEVYQCLSQQVPYFDEVAFRPDFLLREMIQLLHPHVSLGGLRYYRHTPLP